MTKNCRIIIIIIAKSFLNPFFNKNSKNSNVSGCPSSLFFYVVPSTDSRDVFSRSDVQSMEECVAKCYSNEFCFSCQYVPTMRIVENETLTKSGAQCRLSYISAFNCTRKKLNQAYQLSQLPATAECIRCPGLGEHGEQCCVNSTVAQNRPDKFECFSQNFLISNS